MSQTNDAHGALYSISELREQRRKDAAQRGSTVEDELDAFEEEIHSKDYVDCLRLLLGIEELEFARKYCCCSAALFGRSLKETSELQSEEYRSALRGMLNLSDEEWASREYAWANSGYEKPCQGERPCTDCILDRGARFNSRR